MISQPIGSNLISKHKNTKDMKNLKTDKTCYYKIGGCDLVKKKNTDDQVLLLVNACL